MKKAGIITIYGDYYNYGNRLQNYAVQEILRKLNIEAKTIKVIKNNYEDILNTDYNKERYSNFKHFNNYIDFFDEELDVMKSVSDKFDEEFDYYVVGSDQIWNFTFKNLFKPAVFAEFSNKTKIALSASVGVDFMPEDDSYEYKLFEDNLYKYKKITVREDAGKNILEKISKRNDIEVILDPTMLVDKNDWEKVLIKPDGLKKEKYILQEFIGLEDENRKRELDRIARENDCEIIDVLDKNSKYYGMGPSEFLYLVKNAFMVATDSFHACVFSIIFSKPFIVFKREDPSLKSMHSRIETLLSTFEIENNIFKGKIENNIFNTDYNKVHEILNKKKEEGMDILRKAFED